MAMPGKYRTRLTIQTPTVTNTNGNVSETWATAASRWGHVEEAEGQEFTKDDTLHDRRQYTVRMRYYSGLRNKMRITCKVSGVSRTMQLIKSPTTDTGTHFRESVCVCAETDGS